jgi:hypothetical protein
MSKKWIRLARSIHISFLGKRPMFCPAGPGGPCCNETTKGRPVDNPKSGEAYTPAANVRKIETHEIMDYGVIMYDISSTF